MFSLSRSPLIVACMAVALAMSATFVADSIRPEPLPTGLVGRYYDNVNWAGSPIVQAVESPDDLGVFDRHRALASLDAWSVEWSGFLLVRARGVQRFALKSRDASWLSIDDSLVIENVERAAVHTATADVLLEAGVHSIRLRYRKRVADAVLQLAQAGASGTLGAPGPIVPHRASYAAIRFRELWPLGLVAIWYVASGTVLMVALRTIAWRGAMRQLFSSFSDRTFLIVTAVGLAMSAAHIGYGLPAHDSWSPDERDPLSTLAVSHTGFEDWNLRWPPMHLYLVSFALRPFEWAATAFGLPLDDIIVTSSMFLVMRGVSLVMLAMSLMLLFDVARQMFDRRAGYFAIVLLALSPLVVHFGPLVHLEIPHLFWMTASLWAWMRVWRDKTAMAFAVFGGTVGFSLATKDQAYAFYLAAPLACLVVLRQPVVPGRPRQSWAAALRDRRLLVVAVSTTAAFAIGHGLPWHRSRFVAHLEFLLGSEVGVFQMFPATLSGQFELLGVTARSLVWAAGVPLTVSFLAGCVLLVRSPVERRHLVHLLPLATYYAGFLCVILYVYDRFLIGALPVMAIIGGFALRSVADAADLPIKVRTAVPVTLIGAALAGALAQNLVFHDDPRRRASAWLAQHVPCGSSVGVTWSAEYGPALSCYDT
ncbi:MAG: glycosyltransferase family 39 protein, partial [Acidobacteria bacterium]|nr:glycosyltransferase family 39 protein [Acidobacteriota bacterium]